MNRDGIGYTVSHFPCALSQHGTRPWNARHFDAGTVLTLRFDGREERRTVKDMTWDCSIVLDAPIDPAPKGNVEIVHVEPPPPPPPRKQRTLEDISRDAIEWFFDPRNRDDR